MSRFQIYDGKSNPNFYVGLYLNLMALYTGNEPLLCKVFPSSFGQIASHWFHKLSKGTMKSWKGLVIMFVVRFVTNKLQLLRVDSLMALRIGGDESLKAYAKRYYEMFSQIPRCNQEVAVVSFKNGLNDDYLLRKSLAKTLQKNMEELMARIEKYARAEEEMPGAKASK
ncbi:uncharacterized protein LOC114300628 [Camellia sinensis]|uniref:uncharacterized protein LOC114300628 n=1 Tax=Camellia sinensis TaxID=4442 RepID=UPI00103589B3|nr:uncharacterized protein LOC114300628 [Camellia sinensis]